MTAYWNPVIQRWQPNQIDEHNPVSPKSDLDSNVEEMRKRIEELEFQIAELQSNQRAEGKHRVSLMWTIGEQLIASQSRGHRWEDTSSNIIHATANWLEKNNCPVTADWFRKEASL